MLKDFTKLPCDVILQGGQSNADGTGYGPAKKPYWNDGHVWYLNQNGTISAAADRVHDNTPNSDFSLSFAREYIGQGLLAEGRDLLIVRTAVGGTSFQAKQWGLQDHLYLQLLEMTRTALALNPENRLVAFLWHQGESDNGTQGEGLPGLEERHYGNLSNLLKGVREAFGVAPFIAGDFTQEWIELNRESIDPVRKAIRRVCEDFAQAGFVESDGLVSNMAIGANQWQNDTVHFCRQALYEFGERYFQCYQDILKR